MPPNTNARAQKRKKIKTKTAQRAGFFTFREQRDNATGSLLKRYKTTVLKTLDTCRLLNGMTNSALAAARLYGGLDLSGLKKRCHAPDSTRLQGTAVPPPTRPPSLFLSFVTSFLKRRVSNAMGIVTLMRFVKGKPEDNLILSSLCSVYWKIVSCNRSI
jgi:hypothetical protein